MLYRIIVQLEEITNEDEQVGDLVQETKIEIYVDKADAVVHYEGVVDAAIDVCS